MDFSFLTFLAALPEFILIFFALILVLVAAFARQSDGHMKTVRTISLVGYAAGFAALATGFAAFAEAAGAGPVAVADPAKDAAVAGAPALEDAALGAFVV